MSLKQFRFPRGAKRPRKRKGRGEGSGHGKTACRGYNGQKSRSGGSIRPGYEGGQMPLYRRVPKFGFKNPFRVEYATVNVSTLDSVFEDGAVVGPIELIAKRLIRSSAKRVKVLGNGDIKKKLTVKAHKFSRTAKERIVGAGGTVEVI